MGDWRGIDSVARLFPGKRRQSEIRSFRFAGSTLVVRHRSDVSGCEYSMAILAGAALRAVSLAMDVDDCPVRAELYNGYGARIAALGLGFPRGRDDRCFGAISCETCLV